ncbi:MAG: hypothetical protein DWQ01_02030 [Planctomycetota bacterium]|nr:MAG: hypothetical protein DWQ01_02030 [Planctomycetota bacterium]
MSDTQVSHDSVARPETEGLHRLVREVADLCQYPDEKIHSRVEGVLELVTEHLPEHQPQAEKFAEYVRQSSLSSLEEVYTGTFDYAADCALECGWHVFGESYDRGAFLVKMRVALERWNEPEFGLLPDHLHCLMRLLCHPLDFEERSQVMVVVGPALEKICKALESQGNPYHSLLLLAEGTVKGWCSKLPSGEKA